MALERQIRHGMAQGELAHLDALLFCRGRQPQKIEPFDQLPLLVVQLGGMQTFQLDREWQVNGRQGYGCSLLCLALARLLRLGAQHGLGGGLVCSRLVFGRFLPGSLVGSCIGRRCLGQDHAQAIEHGSTHYEPLAIEGGADIQRREGYRDPGYRQIQICHLEAVDLNFQRQGPPDKRLRWRFRCRFRLGNLHHGMGDRQGFYPELALQQLAQIPVQHGPIHSDIHQFILPADPFQGPAVAQLASHQLPLERRQRSPGLQPQPLVALVGEPQQADADEQQEDQPHQPEKNAFYPDHSADPRETYSRSGQRNVHSNEIIIQAPARNAAVAACLPRKSPPPDRA